MDRGGGILIQFLMGLDREILLWIQTALRHDIATPFFIGLTRLGDSGMIWILIALGLLVGRKTRTVGGMALCSLGITFILNNVMLKNLVGRIRPYEVIQGLECLIEKQKDFSFPSGHTGSSFAAAVVLLCCLPKKYGIPAMVLAVLIGFSRLYLGVHYLTDVLCGGMIGTMVALIVYHVGMVLLEKYGDKSVPQKE